MASKDIEKLDDDELQGLVERVLVDCATFTDGELSTHRATATDFYLGKPLGNEEEGRSQIVMTEVRDAVHGILPSFMRVFFSGEKVVEFEPTNAGNVKQAKQRTDYINKILERNKFFSIARACFLDGAVRRIGVVKWGWDDSSDVQAYHLDGVVQSQLEQLTATEGVELKRAKETKAEVKPTMLPAQPAQAGPGAPGAAGGIQPQQPQVDPNAPPPSEAEYSVDFTFKRANGCAKVWSVPPEEFIFNREARDKDTALCIGHRTKKSRGELVAMGIDPKFLEDQSGEITIGDNVEEQARRAVVSGSIAQDPEAGEANDKILYTEAYIRVDADGDGTTELRLFRCVGTEFKVTNDRGEPVPYAPFAVWSPFPEPHTLLGQSIADLTMDLQRWKTNLVRGSNDSLTLSIYPRTKVVEGMATMSDVLNTDIGSVIRVKNIDAVQSFAHDFVGREVLPFLGVVDDILEKRTGLNKGAMGLDADALQSSTDHAVGAALTAAQAQTELLCREFAEQIMRPVMLGLSDLYVEYKPKPETVRLSGEWVEMDPRVWDNDLDVVVNIGIGTTDSAKKTEFYMGVAGKQAEIIGQYGLSNPLCGLPEYRNTLAKIAQLSGVKDIDSYFKEVDPNYQPPAPPAPEKSPQQIQVEGELQISQLKTQRELAMKEAELQQKQQQQTWQQNFDLLKLAQDSTLRREQINAQFKTSYTEMQFEQDTASNEREVQGHLQAQQQTHQQQVDAHNQALAAQQQQHDQQLAQQQQAHAQQMAEQQAAQQAQAPGAQQ